MLPPRRGVVLFHPRCRFTDDTVCTIAIADALMGDRDYAAALRAFVRQHPNRGYASMFRRCAHTDHAPPYGSWGNGAPMRVSAVGWLAAVFQATDWEGAVRTAVALGGDADTLGCIAGAVAEAVHGLPADIARTARAYLSEDLDAVVTRFEPLLPARA